jgi:predicted AlkP superfamily pyrophosphatase or phosphodiesterase
MAGKTRGHTYWIASNTAQFVTSSFYADDYPGWVERINQVEMPVLFGDSVWEQTVPLAAREASRPDTSVYEGDGVHTFFPHRFVDEVSDPLRHGALNRWGYALTPPDAALGVFAGDAVRVLDLGDDEVTDYLAISFSQTDDIGHDFGPLSREQLENLLHLDRTLGSLMRMLDREVGEDRWVLALTGDHGTMTMPEHLSEEGVQARRATREEFAQLRGIFEDHRQMDGEAEAVANHLVASLEQLPFIADAMTVFELTTPPVADSLTLLMRNSYHPDRWTGGSGSQGSGVVFRYVEGFYPSSSPQGTGHGSPYYHDRFVPLIFFGVGVEQGFSMDPVRSVDIAPTLASLAGIAAPDDLDGRPLLK